MQRWNAAGISFPPTFGDTDTRLVVADKILLGEMGYSALRKSLFPHVPPYNSWHLARNTRSL